VTVTHADMTRFFMTIPEAAQLIIEACALGEGSDVYVLDMGEPVPIMFLAEQMIRLSGREPGRDVAIEVTGLRPGEKLEEALFYPDETVLPTRQTRILKASQAAGPAPSLLDAVVALVDAARQGAAPADIDARLKALVAGSGGVPARNAVDELTKIVPIKQL